MKLLREFRSELNRLYLFQLEDGSRIEAVFYRGDTLCVSTQVGCAVGCAFCLSGSAGLLRNLSEDEIYMQYFLLKPFLPIKRVAFAGIGEPLMNYRNVLGAFERFKREGLGVTFYTTGHPIKHLPSLLDLPHRGVTISLHTLDPSLRKKLLPHAGDLEELIALLKDYSKKISKRKKGKISLAYLLLKGVNDSPEEIKAFGRLVKELGFSATLLYYNDTGMGFQAVTPEEYSKAFLLLRSMGVRVTLSTRYRRDPLGGCGTLTINRDSVGVQ